MTDQTTVPTPMGHLVMDPGRRGCGSASGRRVSLVSGRIRGACTSRMRGHSERSLYATRRTGIFKPTAVSCRPGMSGLRNKAICDEIRTLSDPSVRLKHLLSRSGTEARWKCTSMLRRDMMKPRRQYASSDRARQPRRLSGTVSARSGERSRVALVAPSLQSLLRGGRSSPGRHRDCPAEIGYALSTMDRHLSAAVASSSSLCALDGLLTGWIRPQLGGSAFGLSEGPGSQ